MSETTQNTTSVAIFDFENLTSSEILLECGRRQLTENQAKLLLRETYLTPEQIDLYRQGLELGKAELQSALMTAALEGKKDGYANLQKERRNMAVNESLHKNFGI